MAGPQFRFLDTEKVQTSVKWLLGGAFGQANLPSSASPATVQALAAAGYCGFNQTKFAMLVAVPVDVSVTQAGRHSCGAGTVYDRLQQDETEQFPFQRRPGVPLRRQVGPYSNRELRSAKGTIPSNPAKLPSSAIVRGAHEASPGGAGEGRTDADAADSECGEVGDTQAGVGKHQDVDGLRRDRADDRVDFPGFRTPGA